MEKRISAVFDDGDCFACGPHNPHGLGLKFRIEPGSGVAVCETSISRRYNGWRGAAHGGIITTLLDETMVYACTSTGWLTVTGTIQVKFHLPVPVETMVSITGRVIENRGRSIAASAELKLKDKLLACATSVMIPIKHLKEPMELISDRLCN